MPFSCSFCKISGDKGYFRFPKPPDDCLRLAGLPPEKDLKVKITQWVQQANFQDFVQSDFKASWAYLNFLACDWLKFCDVS